MKVLITGGAGFIGSHLAEVYLRRGDEVFIIDDLSTGSLENIKSIQENPSYKDKLTVAIDTIMNYSKMLELIGICDQIIHLAAAVGVQYVIDHPLASIMTNVRGTDITLELCDKFKKKVFLASTSEVYGKHSDVPLRETDDCVYGPTEKFRWSYAAAKLIDEFSGLAYHRTKNLQVTIARFFNVIGARQTGRYGMVVPRLMSQALTGEPMTVYGDGMQTRTFTHVQEVVEILAKLVDCREAVGQVVNVGGIEEVSILELAMRIKKLTGSSSKIVFIPYSEAYPKDFEDMNRRVPSTEKLRKLVGSAPSMGLDEILENIFKSMNSMQR